MTYQLNNNDFSQSLTMPLFDSLQELNFVVQQKSNSFSHICTTGVPFTHVVHDEKDKNDLQEVYNNYFHELADKIETIALSMKDEIVSIDVSETFF